MQPDNNQYNNNQYVPPNQMQNNVNNMGNYTGNMSQGGYDPSQGFPELGGNSQMEGQFPDLGPNNQVNNQVNNQANNQANNQINPQMGNYQMPNQMNPQMGNYQMPNQNNNIIDTSSQPMGMGSQPIVGQDPIIPLQIGNNSIIPPAYPVTTIIKPIGAPMQIAPLPQAQINVGQVNQNQGLNQPLVNNQVVPAGASAGITNPNIFRSQPVFVRCPYCSNNISTVTTATPNYLSIICCICTGAVYWACYQGICGKDCTCHDVQHTCPVCRQLLGEYRAC